MRNFLRKKYRDFLAARVVWNGEMLQSLYRDRTEYLLAGGFDELIDREIERRERLRDELLSKLRTT